MEEVVKFLRENPVQYLATVGRDGKAKCRPFMFAGEQGGKLWFCTNSTKEVYKDMQANPYVEVSVSSPAYAWIRLSGKAVSGLYAGAGLAGAAVSILSAYLYL